MQEILASLNTSTIFEDYSLFYSFFRTLRNPVHPRNPYPQTHWGGALGWVTAPQQRESTSPELDPSPYLSPLCPGLRPPSLYPAGWWNRMSSCPFSDVLVSYRHDRTLTDSTQTQCLQCFLPQIDLVEVSFALQP